jgi:hypothetical protein
MDGPRFDALTRAFANPSRRQLFKVWGATLLAAGMARHGRGDVAAQCKELEQSCARDDDCCEGATCQQGTCTCTPGQPGCDGRSRCTFRQTDDEITFQLEASTSFRGESLTLSVQTLRSDGQMSTLTFRLADRPVLQMESSSEDGVIKVHVIYGDAFAGIADSEVMVEKGTVSGVIDGRPTVPLLLARAVQDPNQIQFEDGGPPPRVRLDPDLDRAMRALIEQAVRDANCVPDRSARRSTTTTAVGPSAVSLGGGVSGVLLISVDALPSRSTLVCDEVTEFCLACYFACDGALTACIAGCAWTLFGFPVCVAGCITVHQDTCIDACDTGVCCSVDCGNDPPSSCCCEGHTCCGGVCCEKDEECKDGNVCCPAEQEVCAGMCCPADTECKKDEGVCCPKDVVACSGACCNTGEDCTDRTCCTSKHVVCEGVCCPKEDDDCQKGGVCCPNSQIVCDGTCCPPKNICWPPEKPVCCPDGQVCGNTCCDELSRCVDKATSTCCAFTESLCAGTCCPSGDACIKDACCPGGQICGQTCCPPNNYCADEKKQTCKPCSEGQTPCPTSIKGAPHCCPVGTSCCGNGKCCPQGIPCCDTTSGPQCDTSCIPK